jgi:hypothetical protein
MPTPTFIPAPDHRSDAAAPRGSGTLAEARLVVKHRRCARNGRVRLRLHVPDGVQVRRVLIRVGDRRTRTLGRRSARRPFVVRRLPRHRVTVRVTLVAVEGRRTFIDRYRRCS